MIESRTKHITEYLQKVKNANKEMTKKKAFKDLLNRLYANNKDVQIIGDIPIYVSTHSADVWAMSDMFEVDEQLNPVLLAGVPPDSFNEEGQLWGNPVYNWQVLRETQYSWWVSRIKHNMKLFDMLRFDHFRGLESFWVVPANAQSAKDGEWRKAFGEELLTTICNRVKNLSMFAEDLGFITPEVDKLRQKFSLPAMRVFQFGFDGSELNPHLPQHYKENIVAYTGTHDNNTIAGWFSELEQEQQEAILAYLNCKREHIAEASIRKIWSSKAFLTIVPIQDLLGLSSEARMNTPGTILSNNWTWKLSDEQFYCVIAKSMQEFNKKYGR